MGDRAPFEVLQGGVANAGAVLRVGDHVERPSNPHSATIHRFLRHVRARGFDGASEPVSVDGARERVVFVPGDVPVPPYPAWSQSDTALASIAHLLRSGVSTTHPRDSTSAKVHGVTSCTTHDPATDP